MNRYADSSIRIEKVRGAWVGIERFLRAQVVSIQIWMNAGGAYESEEEWGCAHFLEHLLFQSRLSKLGFRTLSTIIEEIGGNVNAWTSQIHTVYHATCPKEGFDDVLFAFIHTCLGPEIDMEAMERERGVILQEIAREEENPRLLCMRTLFELRYADHPCGKRVIGSKDSVAKLSAETISGFHGKFYCPERMCIAIVGDVEEETVLRKLDNLLQEYGGRRSRGQAIPKARKAKVTCQRIERPVVESYFAMGYPIPDLKHHDVPAIDILSGVLGETRGCILEAWRQSEGLVNEISTVSYTPPFNGIFMISGTTRPDKTGQAFSSLAKKLTEFFQRGPESTLFQGAVELTRASALRIEETAHGRAGRIGYEMAVANEIGFFKRYLAKVMTLKESDIITAGRRYLSTKPSIVLVCSADNKETPSFSIHISYAKPTFLEPSRYILPDGGVLMHQRDSSHPTVAVRIHVPGGLEYENQQNNGLYALLARLWLCGTGGRQGQAVLRDFDALGAQVGVSAGYSNLALWIDVPAGTCIPAVNLASRCMAEPNLFAHDIRREADLLKESIRSRRDRPVNLLVRELLKRLFGNHPYGLDPLGNQEALDKIEKETLSDALGKSLSPSHVTIGVVGDCDALEVAQQFILAFQRFSNTRLAGSEEATFTEQEEVVELKGPFTQSHVGLAWPGTSMMSEDRIYMSIFGASLGMMSGPLFTTLRDKLGIAYTTQANASSMLKGGYLLVTASVRVGMEYEAMKAMTEIVQKTLQGSTDDIALISRGIRYYAGTLDMSFQKKLTIAHWMCSNEGTPIGFDGYRKITKIIRDTDPSMVIQSVRKYLDVKPVTVILKPE